jgi:hypothetical protein
MGREWELSYRLGMRNAKFYSFALDACPEKCKDIFLAMGELPRNRKAQLLKLPISEYIEFRLHVSKDFFWYSIYFSNR